MLLAILLDGAEPDLSGAASRDVAQQECRVGGSGSDVLVCGRREGLKRYQVTDPKAPWNPSGQGKSQLRERMSWIEEGDTGAGSCSAVGPGGFTRCMLKQHKKNRQQYEGW